MANTYSDQTGLNTRKTLPTSRLGTRNIVWYQFYISYNLLTGEAPDNYTAYDQSDSFYHAIVERIQEAAELYHLGAPTIFANEAFVFGIVDNNINEADPNPFIVGYAQDDITRSSVEQALIQFLGGGGWGLVPCGDMGVGIIAY